MTAGGRCKGSARPCCTPSRVARSSSGAHPAPGEDHDSGEREAASGDGERSALVFDRVSVPGGLALQGTNRPRIADDGEKPLRRRRLRPFLMGATTVTNRQFQAFVNATGYVTDAERLGWSFVFRSDASAPLRAAPAAAGAEWWLGVDGADWKEINGPGTHADAWREDHPVVQVSWNDAGAYARWVGGRLPSEAEWEHAARGGLGDVPFPWGSTEPDDDGVLPCNIWQGRFPHLNTGADGWKTTAPAKSFEANGHGLYNMVGNVWEWTSNPYRVKSLKKQVRKRLEMMRGFRVLKGGSFLCHRSYCYRYRIAARTGNSPDSASTHQGFRVAWDAQEVSGETR